jgi:hypothetical protein
MIYSYELVPFIDSARKVMESFVCGEPRENHDFHDEILSIGTRATWRLLAIYEAGLDTYFDEFPLLLLDNPPILDWIEEWQQNEIPSALDNSKDLIKADKSPISKDNLQDIEAAVKTMVHCQKKANTPEQIAEFWNHYAILRDFYEIHSNDFKLATRVRIHALSKLHDKYLRHDAATKG